MCELSNNTKPDTEIILRLGGKPLIKQYGHGVFPDGTPVLVRSSRKDLSFLILKNNHDNLINKDGHYIFLDRSKDYRVVSAKIVNKLLKDNSWHKDKTYAHKFLRVDQIF